MDYGAVLTEASMDMPRRLKTLYGSLAQLIRKYEPDEASIEELFFNNNAKTAILVGEARGVAVLACADGGLPIGEYASADKAGAGRLRQSRQEASTVHGQDHAGT